MESAIKFLLKDEYIGPLVKKFGHIDLTPRPKSLYFVNLVRSITGQQLSVKAAATIFGRLEEKLTKITPENILGAKEKDLRDCGLSFAKIKYTKDLSERVKSKRLKIKSLDRLSEEEIMNELIAVKGIGHWTAEMFLMFTLGFPDIFPYDDLGLRNGLKKLVGREMGENELIEFAERWKPYRTTASMYIWESLDNKATT